MAKSTAKSMATKTQNERRESNEPLAGPAAPGEMPRTFKRPAPRQRRRHIDPTTCERDYTGDEVEFMRALDGYKRTHGRMFPTCSEILEVLRGLGYEKAT